jgi:adrenodoxin-NADP+ reductase
VAESPRFNFIGNISIGEHASALPLQSLIPHYDTILFAYGASRDRTLGIPGEDTLNSIYSARAFVGWYNGLPEYADLAPDLTQGEEAVIIGQGNVALDVARILLQDPDVLKSTDITANAIEALQKSRIKRVRVVGRRGPLQVGSVDSRGLIWS